MNARFSEYNIIPVGDHCATAIILKEMNIRYKSYPFDWVTHAEQLYGSNIVHNIDLIAKLKTESTESIVKQYIGDALGDSSKRNSVTNIWFPHDTEAPADVIQKYERRFERLKHDLSKKNLFILLTRHYYIDEATFQKIMDVLLSFNKESKILFISGSDHAYLSGGKYENVLFKYIYYDVSQFYDYDYTDFRPNLKRYLTELLL